MRKHAKLAWLAACAGLAMLAGCGDDTTNAPPINLPGTVPTASPTPSATPSTFPTGNPAEEACVAGGGSVGSATCCPSATDFPNTCTIGICGCPPDTSQIVLVCNCPVGKCWNGNTCV